MAPIVAMLPTFVTANEYTPLVPTWKLPLWLFARERSILFTVVGSADVLFAALTSPAVDTLALLVTLGNAAADTLTVSVIALAPLFPTIGPGLVQLTTWPAAEQLQPVPLLDTKL